MCCANKNLLIVLVIFVVLAFLATSEKPGTQFERARALFSVADFSQIVKIEISPRLDSEKIVLVHGTDGWYLPSLANFPADVRKIQDLVYRSSTIKMGDKISSDGEFLVEYGLVREGDFKLGTQLSYYDAEGTLLSSVVLGNDRLRDGMFGQMPSGQYVRPANENAVYLIADNFRVETRLMDWVNKQLPELKADDVVRIYTEPHDADGIELQKDGDQFNLTGLQTETEELDETNLKVLCGVLENFHFTELAERESAQPSASLTTESKFIAAAKNGLQTIVKLGEKDEATASLWAVINWEYSGDDVAVKSLADSLNQRWEKWAFSVSEYAGKSLFKSRAELVKEKTIAEPEVLAEPGITTDSIDKNDVVSKNVPVQEGKEMQNKETLQTVRASHILISYKGAERSQATRTKEEALALATELLEKLKAGTDELDELAAEFSDCGSAQSGGDLGSFKRGAMVGPFNDAVFELAAGEMASELVETVFGYHIIQRTK